MQGTAEGAIPVTAQAHEPIGIGKSVKSMGSDSIDQGIQE
jgi:hypothetical protein